MKQVCMSIMNDHISKSDLNNQKPVDGVIQ